MFKLFVPFVFIFFQVTAFFPTISASSSFKIVNDKDKNDSLDSWKAPKMISTLFPYYVSGFDMENRPVFVIEIGKWPVREYVEKGGQELNDLTKYFQQFFRRVEIGPRAFFNESEILADGSTLIMDWDGFSWTQFIHGPTTAFVLNHFAAFQRIQDSLASAFWVNVNAVATQFITLARPLLGSVMERVEVYGSENSHWVPKLLRKIDQSQLPAWYGGRQVDFKPVIIYG